MKVVLIAPAMNELDGLKVVLPRLDKKLIDEIIVVDLNSTDGSLEYCRANGYRVHHQQTRGYGNAFKEVLAYNNADIVVEFNTDGSSLPEAVPQLIEKIKEGYDLVIASRYIDGAISYDDSWVTRLGNWGFTTLINVLFGGHYTDSLVGIRAYRRAAFDKLKINTPGLSWTAQQSVQFARAKMRVTEIGADEPARIGGIRKMHPIKTGWEILMLVLKEFFND